MKTRVIVLAAVLLAALAALGIYLQPRLGSAPVAGIGLTPGPEASSAPIAGTAEPSARTSLAPGIPSAAVSGPKGVVVGVGTARAAPDVAFATVGVQTRAPTAKEAQEKNNATMTAVLAQIKALGIAENDIQTSGISLWPVTERENQVTGYQARNGVTVRVQDVNQAGAVLDAAVAGGANTAGNVRFGLKDSSAVHKQALEAAAKDAQGKAEAIAKALGVQIKAVESAVEEVAGGPMPTEAVGLEARGAPVPVQPGELTVTARLRVTYSY